MSCGFGTVRGSRSTAAITTLVAGNTSHRPRPTNRSFGAKSRYGWALCAFCEGIEIVQNTRSNFQPGPGIGVTTAATDCAVPRFSQVADLWLCLARCRVDRIGILSAAVRCETRSESVHRYVFIDMKLTVQTF